MSGKQFVDPNAVNAQAMKLPQIFHTLTDGVQPESGQMALSRLKMTSDELQNALGRLGVKLGELADIWQAPSTEQGSNAIRDVKDHVDRLSDHAGQLGSAFGDYIDHVGTARARVPEPRWFDRLVESPTPAESLWLGPVLPIMEHDLRQRTHEARELMQGLTYAAYAVDAATPGFEPLPSQVVEPEAKPGGPPVPGGGGSRRRSTGPALAGPGQAATGTPSAAPQLSPTMPPPAVNPTTLAPDQLTALSNAGPQVTVATPVTVDPGRIAAPGGSAGVGGLPLPGGQSTGAVGRGASGGALGRGGQSGGGNFGGGPGRGSVGAPRGAGFPGRDGLAARGASGRAGASGVGGPMGAAGGGHGDDDDYEHQRAAYLHADETADELFGTDEKTAPPVIGGPDE